MSLKNTCFFAVVVVLGLFSPACQNKKLVENKSPFSANIVRLGDTPVADIDGTQIFLSDVEHAALAKGLLKPGESLTPDNPVFHTVLDELIDQRLLALEALRQSLDQKDETKRRLAAMREKILSNTVIENLLAKKITDDAIARMYKEQSRLKTYGEQVLARIMKLPTEEQAKTMKTLIEQGGDFAALAKEYSQDQSTRDLGGSLGYFTKNAIDKSISDIAFALQNGEVSGPVKIGDYWVLVQTEDRRQAPQPRLEDIKDDIERYMTYDEIDKLLRYLRENSQIKLKLAAGTVPKDPAPTGSQNGENQK